jgi:hypothetical protein
MFENITWPNHATYNIIPEKTGTLLEGEANVEVHKFVEEDIWIDEPSTEVAIA